MQLLRAAPVIEGIKARQSAECADLQPSLAVILAMGEQGVDPASELYVAHKKRYGEKIGALVAVHRLAQPAIADRIAELNEDVSTHGIIVQLPLPNRDQEDELCQAIDPRKDVDGLHPQSRHLPATPLGIMNLLAGYDIEVADRVVTVNGARGKLVGQGAVELMRKAGAAVIEIDQPNASELPSAIYASDILVTAVGKTNFSISAEMVDREGLVVVDAGVRKVEPNSPPTRGDLDPKAYQLETDGLRLTPHIGGTGPMTVAALLTNVITAARNSRGVLV